MLMLLKTHSRCESNGIPAGGSTAKVQWNSRTLPRHDFYSSVSVQGLPKELSLTCKALQTKTLVPVFGALG